MPRNDLEGQEPESAEGCVIEGVEGVCDVPDEDEDESLCDGGVWEQCVRCVQRVRYGNGILDDGAEMAVRGPIELDENDEDLSDVCGGVDYEQVVADQLFEDSEEEGFCDEDEVEPKSVEEDDGDGGGGEVGLDGRPLDGLCRGEFDDYIYPMEREECLHDLLGLVENAIALSGEERNREELKIFFDATGENYDITLSPEEICGIVEEGAIKIAEGNGWLDGGVQFLTFRRELDEALVRGLTRYEENQRKAAENATFTPEEIKADQAFLEGGEA